MTEDVPGAPQRPEPGATITPYDDGPLLVRGDFQLVAPDGTPIPRGRRTVALCRCGRSGAKPYCDGTHKLIGFVAPGAVAGPPGTGQGSAVPWSPGSGSGSPV